MRVGTLIVMLVAVPVFAIDPIYAQDFRGRGREFNELVQTMPGVSIEQVGTIQVPLPDWRGFHLPGRWRPVKMINDTSVYLVWDFYNFLHPKVDDLSHSNYVLWRNMRGQYPKIILWNCPNKSVRAARIAKINRVDQERAIREAKRNEEAERNSARREQERQLRVAARRKELIRQTTRKRAASQARYQDVFSMQQSLANAVMDKMAMALVHEGQASTFSVDDGSVRQDIAAIMAIQIQQRDMQWCTAIQRHLAPKMWNRSPSFRDTLKSSDPESVIEWLQREVERQTADVEFRVDYEENERDQLKIMQIDENID